jgi:cell division protein FtsX
MSITFNAHSPIHREIESLPSSALADSGMTWSRTTRWIVTTAKQVLPAIAVFALFATVLTATIALRLAIWLPLYYRH